MTPQSESTQLPPMQQVDKQPSKDQMSKLVDLLDEWPKAQLHQIEEAFAGSQSREFYEGMVCAITHARAMFRHMLATKQNAALMDLTWQTYQAVAAKQALLKQPPQSQPHDTL